MIELEMCPVCGSLDHVILELPEVHRHPEQLNQKALASLTRSQTVTGTWRRCVCNFIFQSPRKTDAEFKDFYHDQYRDPNYPSDKDLRTHHIRMKRQLEYITDHVVEAKAALDIGCATGVLLEALRSRYECIVDGTEYNPIDREILTNKGIGSYSDLDELPDRKVYDVIVMSHVLEHVQNPKTFLERLRTEFFAPRGHLLIEIPSLNTMSAWWDFHLSVFTPNTLWEVAIRAGMVPLDLKLHSSDPPTLISMVARVP